MLSFLFERKRISLKIAVPFFLQAKYPQWYLYLCDVILNLAILFTIALEALQLSDNYHCNKAATLNIYYVPGVLQTSHLLSKIVSYMVSLLSHRQNTKVFVLNQ